MINIKNKSNSFSLNSIVILICTFSFYFLWDLNNFIQLDNKYYYFFQVKFIFLILLFMVISNFDIKKIIKYRYFFYLFFLHQIYTVFIIQADTYKSILSFSCLIIILFITIHLKKKIFFSLIISYYLIIIFLAFNILINFYDNFSFTDISVCSLNSASQKFIFFENSHFSMLFVSIFFYMSYIFFEKKNLYNFFFLILTFLLILINFSLLFFIGYIFSCIIIFIFKYFNYIELKKSFVIYLSIFFISFLNFIYFKEGCNIRINDTFQSFQNFSTINEKSVDFSNNISANYNLSSMVYVSHFKNMLVNFKEYPFGVGINNYKFFYLKNLKNNNFDQVLISKNSNQPLNINDGRSVLIKGVTEFGVFVLIFLISFFYFIRNKKVSIKKKIVIISLLVTQLIAGAGYFNGGFLVTLFLMISYSPFFKPNFFINN